MDGKHVVFGKVIKGMSTVKRLEKIEKNGEKPQKDCKISMCGELAPGEDDGMAPKGKIIKKNYKFAILKND